jgi:hypothetical protein
MESGESRKFSEQRQALIERSDAAGGDIDKWIAAYTDTEPPMSELARLETLLKLRRDALEALMRLDEDFIDYLVSHRPPV